MPTYADVAPDVMEAFGTWFRDLRRQQQRKANRGHGNPVVFLRDAANNSITEVVEPFSHLTRLEEMQRGGVADAERQWRAFVAKHGALPCGPAVTAVRLQQRVMLSLALHDDVCRCEAKQRDCLIAARNKWIHEIELRNEYELQCMQDCVQRALGARAARGVTAQCLREESQGRATIAHVSEARLRCIHQAREAAYVQLCAVARCGMDSCRENEDVLRELVEEEAQCRAGLGAAAGRHFSAMQGAATQQLERLAHAVEAIHMAQYRAHVGVFSTILDVEGRCRQLLMDAEQAHHRECAVKERQQRESMQLDALRSMTSRDGALLQREQLVRDTVENEVAVRTQIVEAYIRWVTQVAASDMMLIGTYRAKEDVAYDRTARRLVDAIGRLVATEAMERAAIGARSSEWLANHFEPLERLQRAGIPAQIERRIAHDTSLQQPPSKHLQLRTDVVASESVVRRQIALGEMRWRADIATRLEQVIRGAPDVALLLREVSEREAAQRIATVDSEQRWRCFLVQSHEAERAKKGTTNKSGNASGIASLAKQKKKSV